MLLLLDELRVLMLIDLARWHLLRMAPRPGAGSARLRHSAGGRRPLPQTLLSEIDGLGLRDRAVGVSLIGRRPGLILRLLLIEVHALLRRDRHDRFQITRELHMLARRHLQRNEIRYFRIVVRPQIAGIEIYAR